jgi:hypothetical protein
VFIAVLSYCAESESKETLSSLFLFVNAISIDARPIWKNERTKSVPILRKALKGKCSRYANFAKIEIVMHIDIRSEETMYTTCSEISSLYPIVKIKIIIVKKQTDHEMMFAPLLEKIMDLNFYSVGLCYLSILIGVESDKLSCLIFLN